MTPCDEGFFRTLHCCQHYYTKPGVEGFIDSVQVFKPFGGFHRPYGQTFKPHLEDFIKPMFKVLTLFRCLSLTWRISSTLCSDNQAVPGGLSTTYYNGDAVQVLKASPGGMFRPLVQVFKPQLEDFIDPIFKDSSLTPHIRNFILSSSPKTLGSLFRFSSLTWRIASTNFYHCYDMCVSTNYK